MILSVTISSSHMNRAVKNPSTEYLCFNFPKNFWRINHKTTAFYFDFLETYRAFCVNFVEIVNRAGFLDSFEPFSTAP